MEIEPEKEVRTELTRSRIVAPQRESILTAVEIQPEKQGADGIKFLAVETWVRRLLGNIGSGRLKTVLRATLFSGSGRLIRQTFN